jgi:FkbM family methyltransferase
MIQTMDPASPFPVFITPTGQKIFHHSPQETKFVYHEIFEDRIYFRHGITLKQNDTVFDIGANIGLFSLFVAQHFPTTTVHAFEPSPQIYKILQANLAPFGPRAVPHNSGIAAHPGQATFTYYPHYSIMSGFHAHPTHDMQTLRSAIKTQLQSASPEADVEDRHVDWIVQAALAEQEQFTCELRTVSDILDETSTSELALLKIDAEGSELDILSGIGAEHWPRIRQIATEIHDRDGTSCPRITRLLEGQGFRCIVEQDPHLQNSGITNCYALRHPQN